MNRQPIDSKTGLCSAGYDAAMETLELEFKSRKDGEPNKLYHYAKFPQAEWESFCRALSKGSFFLKFIKPTYACTKLSGELVASAPTNSMATVPKAWCSHCEKLVTAVNGYCSNFGCGYRVEEEIPDIERLESLKAEEPSDASKSQAQSGDTQTDSTE
jgi:KTSC domain-containing protein